MHRPFVAPPNRRASVLAGMAEIPRIRAREDFLIGTGISERTRYLAWLVLGTDNQ